jgi:hypothetical protein
MPPPAPGYSDDMAQQGGDAGSEPAVAAFDADQGAAGYNFAVIPQSDDGAVADAHAGDPYGLPPPPSPLNDDMVGLSNGASDNMADIPVQEEDDGMMAMGDDQMDSVDF